MNLHAIKPCSYGKVGCHAKACDDRLYLVHAHGFGGLFAVIRVRRGDDFAKLGKRLIIVMMNLQNRFCTAFFDDVGGFGQACQMALIIGGLLPDKGFTAWVYQSRRCDK